MADNQSGNVVFIMTDAQRYDMIGANGNSWIKTPSLDRLAASGMNCHGAYTTTPLCTPARAALFTGLYASSSGAGSNQQSVHRNVKYLGELCSAKNIVSGYIGKWHIGDRDGYYGNGKVDGGFLAEYWYDGKNFQDDVGEEAFKKWKKRDNLDTNDCWGTRVADRAEKFIEKFKDEHFYLAVSFDEPHGPFAAPEHFYEDFKGTTRDWQENMGDDLSDKPAMHRAMREYAGKGGLVEPAGSRPNNSYPYYGCNTYVDGQIGRVLEAIEKHCPDNTTIIYTSDHGDHQGAHQLTAKGNTMYEETVHVPLIIKSPGKTKAGSNCQELISHIDLAPLTFRLLGIDVPDEFHGRDALPLLSDSNASFRNEVFLEFNRFGLGHHNHWGFMPIRCIRTTDYKLVINLCDTDELYDLRNDLGECKNLITDSAYEDTRNKLHDRLLQWMDDRIDPLRGQGWWGRYWRPEHQMDVKAAAATHDVITGELRS